MRPDHGVEVQNINKRVFSGILIIPAPLARLLESERFVQADGGRVADPHFKHCSQYARFFGFPQGCGHEEASEAAAPSVRAHRDIEDFHFIRRMVHGYVPRKAFFAGRFADAEGAEGVPGEGVGKSQRRPRRLSALTPVRSGEAREEAAERALAELDVPAEGLTELATFRPEAGRVSLTLFEASMPEGARETLNGTLLDRDELCGLAAGFPELFTEEWLWIVRSGCLWETRPRLSRR